MQNTLVINKTPMTKTTTTRGHEATTNLIRNGAGRKRACMPYARRKNGIGGNSSNGQYLSIHQPNNNERSDTRAKNCPSNKRNKVTLWLRIVCIHVDEYQQLQPSVVVVVMFSEGIRIRSLVKQEAILHRRMADGMVGWCGLYYGNSLLFGVIQYSMHPCAFVCDVYIRELIM